MVMSSLIVVDHRVLSDYFRKKKNRFNIYLHMHVLPHAYHYSILGIRKTNNLK